MGDEASKIARAVKWLREKDSTSRINRVPDIRYSGDAAIAMLRRSLDAFARMDAYAAASILEEDESVDERFRATLQAADHLHDGGSALDLGLRRHRSGSRRRSSASAITAKNVAEHVIFIAQGCGRTSSAGRRR